MTAIEGVKKLFPGLRVEQEEITYMRGPYVSGYRDKLELDAQFTVEQLHALISWMEAAAAEVGPSEYTQGYRHGFAGYEEAVAAAIERCAQVADTFDAELDPDTYTASDIASAIRALKDKQ